MTVADWPALAGAKRSPARVMGVLIALFLGWLIGYPLLMTFLEALGGPGAWTLGYFGEFFGRPDEWRAVWRSLWLSIATVLVSGAVGIPLAFVFERLEFPGRRLLGALVALPVALPPLVGVIAFLFLYGESGLVARGLQSVGVRGATWSLNGPLAILLVHAYSMYVYFYLLVRAGLARLDVGVVEAAASLGAGRVRVLVRVVLPMLRPALAGATLLTFMTALASFSAPYIFGGGFRVMTTQIVSSKLNGELEMARVETTMLALMALLGLWLLRHIDSGQDLTAGERGVAPERTVIRGPFARSAAGVLGWSLAILMLLPHFTLLLISFVPPHTWTVEAVPPVLNLGNYQQLFSEVERLRPAINSLWMAVVATSGALFLGVAAARSSLRLGGALGRLLEGLLALPWAIPGTVFAIALATTFSVSEPWLGRFVLVGTPVLLPLAYLVRSLPMTGRGALAGLRRLDPRLEESSASLGAGAIRTMLKVVVPSIRPALAAAACLAFLTSLGDFVASIVLFTYDTRPISIEILSSLRLQETGVAAAYGVLLMVLSASVFFLWGRRAEA